MTLREMQPNEKNRLISRREVQAKTSYSASHIYAKMAKGEFPAPVRISERRIAWLESEIDQWIAELIANRNASNVTMEG